MALYRKYTDSEYRTMTLTEFVDAINEIVRTNSQSEEAPEGTVEEGTENQSNITSFTINESDEPITEDNHIVHDNGTISLKRLILTGELEPEHQGLSDKIKNISFDKSEVNTDQVTSFAGVFQNLNLESAFNVTTLVTDGLTTPFRKEHWPQSVNKVISDLFMSSNVETTYSDESGEHDIFTSSDNYHIINSSNIETLCYVRNNHTTKTDKLYKGVERLEFQVRIPSESYIIPNNVSIQSVNVDIYTKQGEEDSVKAETLTYNARDIYDSQLNENSIKSYTVPVDFAFDEIGYSIRIGDGSDITKANIINVEIDKENYGFGLTVQSEDDNLILYPGKSKKYTASLVDAKSTVVLSSVSINTPEGGLEGVSINPVDGDACSLSISFNESVENKVFERTLVFTGIVTISEVSSEVTCTKDVKLYYLVKADFGELSKTAILNGSGVNDSHGTITVPLWQQDFGTLTASAVLKKGVPNIPPAPEEELTEEVTEQAGDTETEQAGDVTDPAHATEDTAEAVETELLPEDSAAGELVFTGSIIDDGATVTFNNETGTFGVVIAKDKLTEADTYTVEVTITSEALPDISIPVKQTLVLEETFVTVTGDLNKVLKSGDSVTYTASLSGFVDNLEITDVIVANKPDNVSFNEDATDSTVLTFNSTDVNGIVKQTLTVDVTIKEKEEYVVVSKDLDVCLLSLVNFEATDFSQAILDENQILENNISTITVKDYNQTDFANVEFTAEIYLRDEKLDDSTITVEKIENGATVSVIKEQITRVGKYTVKLFVKDSSWAAENSLIITKSFDVTILGVIDTDPTNNIEGVAETVKCVLRFNW